MYFWDGKQIIYEPKEIQITNCESYLNMPCCDDKSNDYTFGRYGMFCEPHKNGWNCYWKGGRADVLPKEFRTHLLLLGVS